MILWELTNVPAQRQCPNCPISAMSMPTTQHLGEAQIQGNSCPRGWKPKSSFWPSVREEAEVHGSLDGMVSTPLAMPTAVLGLNPLARQSHGLCWSTGVVVWAFKLMPLYSGLSKYPDFHPVSKPHHNGSLPVQCTKRKLWCM